MQNDEAKKEIFRTHLETWRQIINARLGLLSTVSGLFAALLVVATFNEKLLPTTNFVRILIVIMLLLMVLSLLSNFFELSQGEKTTISELEKSTGLNLKKIIRVTTSHEKRKLYIMQDYFIRYSRSFIPYFFVAVVICLIALILKNI